MPGKHSNPTTCPFLLLTDVDTFARRMAYLTRLIYLENFDTPEGFITLQTAEIDRAGRIDRPHVVSIPGRYYAYQEGLAVVASVSSLVSMIRFAVSLLRYGKAEVIATCWEPAVEDCFKGLLLHMWHDYPEARPGIERHWPAVGRVARNPVSVQDFDREVAAVLSEHQECTFTRREMDTVVLHTVYGDDVELGWIKISPSTGIVPGPHVAYGSTALTRFLKAQESNQDVEQERSHVRLVQELFTDVGRSIKERRWALERVEEALPVHPVEVQDQPSSYERYIFRRRGDYWEIAYQGEPVYLKDIRGLTYIAFLLQYPHREFDVMALVAAVEKTTTGAGIAPHAEESLQEYSDGYDEYPVMDGQAKRACRERLLGLKEERKQATELEDDAWLQEIDEETAQIEEYLTRGTGVRGKTRSFSTSREKARAKVQQQIRAARDRVGQYNPALFAHLQSCIRTGRYCSYNPTPDAAITWEL